MKQVILILTWLIFSFTSIAQNVLSIGSTDISLEEFNNIFIKNNNNVEVTKEYLDEYMQLFINFKLKVKEAEELRMDTISSFLKELNGYKEQLAQPYLKNKEFDDQMILEAYNRMLYDIRVSHILVSVDSESSKKTNQNAYNKAISIRNKILNKEISFADAAIKYSDDKSALSNFGDLGYFTVFMMVYDFESAAYNNNVGDVSMPIKTKYGYHILTTHDKRDAIGEIEVAHIMFKVAEGSADLSAKEKIFEVYDKLQNGDDFADLAERFSEDRTTAVKGGRLPAFGVGKKVPQFEQNAFALKNTGDISKPFKTNYGWHIVLLLNRNQIGSFSEEESDIKRKIKNDSRSELSEKALLDKLHKEYRVKNRVSVFSSLRKKAFLQVSNAVWKGEYATPNSVLFSIEDTFILADRFIKYVIKNQKKGSDFDLMYQDFVNKSLLDYERDQLEHKYPEYKSLINEYREGILLFDLTNMKVWKKAVEDSVGLYNFFDLNKDKYMWQERVDATVYTCANNTIAQKIKSHIFKKNIGIKVKEDKILLQDLNDKNPLSLQVSSNTFAKGDNNYIDKVIWERGLASDIKLDDGSIVLINIHDILPVEHKNLLDVRGKVISDYQNKLDADWILKLRAKYSIRINQDLLYTLIK